MSREKIFEQKAEKIINEAVDFCVTYTDRKQKLLKNPGDSNKLRKACNEYMRFAMEVYTEGSNPLLRLEGDTQILLSDLRSIQEQEIFHPDVKILELDEIFFEYRSGPRGSSYIRYFIDGSTLDDANPRIYHVDPSIINEVDHSEFDKHYIGGLLATSRTIDYFVEEGFRRGCVNLHQKGAWNFSASLSAKLRQAVYNKDKEVNTSINKEINEVVKSQIHHGMDVEYILDLDGGNSQSFPAFTISYASCNEMESSYFPQKTSSGWRLSVITDGNNLTDTLNNELNLLVKRANEIIDYHKRN